MDVYWIFLNVLSAFLEALHFSLSIINMMSAVIEFLNVKPNLRFWHKPSVVVNSVYKPMTSVNRCPQERSLLQSFFISLNFCFMFIWTGPMGARASLVVQMLRRLPAVLETRVQSLSPEDPLEKEMATHSSIPAWRISRTEEPGGLQSMGSQSQIWLTFSLSLRVPISFQQYFIQHC